MSGTGYSECSWIGAPMNGNEAGEHPDEDDSSATR